jgi:hypothetical protein
MARSWLPLPGRERVRDRAGNGGSGISLAGTLAVAALMAGGLVAVTGCETATTEKTHFAGDTSDITTTPPATAHADAPGTQAEGQPPVPGSPTASNADGTQPPNDMQARNSSLRHHEVSAGNPKQ